MSPTPIITYLRFRWSGLLAVEATLALTLIGCTTANQSTPTALATAAHSTHTVPHISTEVAFPDLGSKPFGENPVFLTHPPDDTNRIAVVEKEGRISIFENTPNVTATSTLLDIQSQVSSAGREEGLLGLAFHPEYSTNGYFYVYYSAANPRRSIISRFTLTSESNTADAASEEIILEVPQPYPNHNGGMIEFGPDGYLYIALGDGGSSGDPMSSSQNTVTLLGSILRIDVDNATGDRKYGIPEDNPFASSPDGPQDPRPEIFAYGLRNPWRFSFDRETGELWVADVGQNAWEEINVVTLGGNYGWNTLEGTHCFSPSSTCDRSGTILPIIEYDHLGRCSVTGGYVYRSSVLPELIGTYIYADFCSGEVWGLRTDRRDETPTLISVNQRSIASFGQDSERNLYTLSLGGQVHRITLAD